MSAARRICLFSFLLFLGATFLTLRCSYNMTEICVRPIAAVCTPK